ncbi:HRDC domain-containing protein [Deinococcus depolymerans]|uniref:HRDC domain-containing protein n=1 Tax=Deinococcus depolymerans TaxID=392408 RepID=A0ABN1BQH9_9DEIO
MTDAPAPLRPDARLVRLHAERGDPQARLAGALAALEGADWALLLRDEDALARQLAAQLGRGTLRVDPRVRVNRDALAAAGLAAASLDADWRGARAVWLMEASADDLDRARRAGVPVISDATLAPGGDWLRRGAALTVYRDSVTLTGHGDAPLAALFGSGRAPESVGAPPSDLSVSLALRDAATLPLRLARAARTTAQLAERLGGAAQPAGPTALLLAPDAAPDTTAPSGGVLAAARSVGGGVLLTPGLEDLGVTLTLLRAAGTTPPEQSGRAQADRTPPIPERDGPPEGRGDDRREFRRGGRDRAAFDRGGRPRRDEGRRDEPRRDEPRREDRPRREAGPDRVTFEAPAATPAQAPVAMPAQAPAEEVWEPEIVFSDTPSPAHMPLPMPVSSGPDAPNLPAGLPDVRHLDPVPADAPTDTAVPADTAVLTDTAAPPETAPRRDRSAREDRPARGERPARNERQGRPRPGAAPVTAEPTPVILVPDLPGSKEDPAANLTDEQAAVYARLRDWRNSEAKRQEISRFIVASNATLAEIARRIPYTEADLQEVRGMGPERLRKYGQTILEVVRG